METRVLHEITPLAESDFMYVADRHKTEFNYPIHNHDVCELNFVENAAGCRRVVGDSSEVIGDYDLVLITGPELVMKSPCNSISISTTNPDLSAPIRWLPFASSVNGRNEGWHSR